MDLESTALLIAAAGWIVPVVLLILFRRALRRDGARESDGLLLLQGQLDALREQVRGSLDEGRRDIDLRLDQTQRVIGDVQRGLGQLDRQARSVESVARDLRGLQELLRSPKLRGGLGEYLLAELLAQVLPTAHFSLQYEFSGGERVDAVVRVGDGLVPVDAKFPLEGFERLRQADPADDDTIRRLKRELARTVRGHIDDIATRYIRSDEGTFDFAMMYVPAEALYRELLDADPDADLLHYALSRRVVPVSPQTFFAYLQVIVLGLRGLRVEQRTRELIERLGGARRHLDRFGESFETAVRHVGNAERQLDESARRLARLQAALDELSE